MQGVPCWYHCSHHRHHGCMFKVPKRDVRAGFRTEQVHEMLFREIFDGSGRNLCLNMFRLGLRRGQVVFVEFLVPFFIDTGLPGLFRGQVERRRRCRL